ncbi:Dihydrosphingosine 1-phosphate phosphatase [Yarrowia sp. C11]|nr:Dihydrosphingosine 1-phosphate phosphatase [Yarrowia sp. C11]KAG5370873.1 Dihydrosphingosine 1-phosphate phosphatase [Yarrowia sp. E02]
MHTSTPTTPKQSVVPENLHQASTSPDLLPFPSLQSNPLTPGRSDDIPAVASTTNTYPAASTRSYSFEDLRPEAQESLMRNTNMAEKHDMVDVGHDLSPSSRTSSIQSFLGNYEMPQVEPHKAAGNKSTDHYKSRMSPWRYRMRSAMLPLIRWETPYLAQIQKSSRNIWLDVYFAMTANLGTHTFYVIMLPVLFWFGQADMARGLVFVLAYGVYVSGVIKDLLCLPRPLSPPLHRITMSGSAALEYGFPSTHTTNAVSVTLLFLQKLYECRDSLSSFSFESLRALCLLYGASIICGRIYCGMHGFLDVISGFLLGALLWWIRFAFGDLMDATTTAEAPYALLAIPLALLLVRVHPEPVDSCPCFDDGVAFMGVIMGQDVGIWLFGKTQYSTSVPLRGAIAYNFQDIGVIKSVLRVVVGIMLVLVWRAVAKPMMHTYLPPFFRIIERVGLSMPRRFFLSASEYKDVPGQIPDSTLIEPHEIPSLIHKLGHARKDSVGPQSTADVIESIAYAEYQRQRQDKKLGVDDDTPYPNAEGVSYRGDKTSSKTDEKCGHSHAHDQDAEDELFASIQPPRVRYDVEVVTKLIVYSGIGCLVMFCGVVFQVVGLGVTPEHLTHVVKI